MKRIMTIWLSVCLALTTAFAAPATTPVTTQANGSKSLELAASVSKTQMQQQSLRGVWVSTVYNLDYPKKASADPASLKAEADAILNQVKALGLNAVFLQIRPTGDALYQSNQFPWSKYLTGTQGVAPKSNFDPLAYWVEGAHQRGLQLHAWLNPYRVTNDVVKATDDPFKALSDNNPAKQNKNLVVRYTDGKLYYNPGIPQVRTMLVSEITDIVKRYAVDGIHFDDYFYPGQGFADQEAYALYGGGLKIEDWRRENVNQLIREVNGAIKATNPKVQFGVSPFGIWANKNTSPEGSATTGNQSYYSHYADSKRWVKEGIIDYIMPQIYWHAGFAAADYNVLLSWWQEVVKNTNVKLYIGLAAYRSGDKDATSPWAGDGEILRQLVTNQGAPAVWGSVFFRYSNLTARPSLGQTIQNFYETPTTVVPVENQAPLTVTMPAKDMSTTLTGYYVAGLSDPRLTLYLNGTPILDRSPRGYFGTFVKLNPGANKLVFTQGSKSFTRTITLGKGTVVNTSSTSSSSGASTTSQAAALQAVIVKTSTFPQKPEVWQAGEKVTLSCVAPVGSTVSATIGTATILMVPKSTAKPTAKIMHTQFTATYTLPALAANTKIQNLGNPVYTMKFAGASKQEAAPSNITLVTKDAPYFAQVTGTDVDTFLYSSTSKGAAYLLTTGMIDTLSGMTGDMVRLGNNKWIKKADVKTYVDAQLPPNVVTQAQYEVGLAYDVLRLTTTSPVAVNASLVGSKVTIDLPNTPLAPTVVVPEGAMTSMAVSSATTGANRSQIVLSLKPGTRLGGYYVEKTQTGVAVYLKRPVKALNDNQPLKGIRVMIDPGHGGKDPGALGLLGSQYSEKHINLDTSLRLRVHLQNLGATVIMTRETDLDLSLNERLRLSYSQKPDLFISMHANSIGPEKNINNILGFSAHYKDEVAKSASQKVLDSVISTLKRKSRGVANDNFYVVRGTWAPSLLLETGFVPNPLEFDWLTTQAEQDALAKSIAQGILAYFQQ